MSIAFSPATPQRFQEICALYQDVIRDMRARGLKQWEWDVYPTRAQLEDDIMHGRLYRVEDEGRLIAAFALGDAMEPEYARITWEYGVRPATLHRFAMACESLDLASRVLAFVKEEALRLGYDSLRLDTCVEDSAMLKVFSSAMTREAGRTFFENPGVTSVCFESPLSDACPMLPLRMYPAYRHGDMTPWGGDALRTVYGREKRWRSAPSRSWKAAPSQVKRCPFCWSGTGRACRAIMRVRRFPCCSSFWRPAIR